jgi:hypothetical protein
MTWADRQRHQPERPELLTSLTPRGRAIIVGGEGDPLAEAADAMRRLEAREVRGKLVISPRQLAEK